MKQLRVYMSTCIILGLLGMMLNLVLPAGTVGTISLTPDQDYTIPYLSNENITYRCEVASEREVVWTIILSGNRPQIQIQDDQMRLNVQNEYGLFIEGLMTNDSRLVVTQQAREVFPQLEFGCFPLSIITIFPTHTITTFGPLEPPDPSSLRFSASSESELQLSWAAIDVPNSEVDVVYYIQVRNLSSGVLEEFNTSETSVEFSEHGICSEFNLTVFSSNEQVGNSSTVVSIMENIPISPNVSTISDSIMTVVNLTSDVSITIMFQPATVCSDNYPVEYYTVTLENGTEIAPARITDCPGELNCTTVTISETDIPGLSVDQVVNYSVSACSHVTCRTTETLRAYTTGVQQPSVYYIEGSTYVLLTCDFATGSNASGCLFNFTITSGMVDSELYNFSRDSTESSSLCDGDSRACMCLSANRFVTSYATIEAYTLEEDGVTRSNISVPAIRKAVSENTEEISVCIPKPTEEPIVPGAKLNTGAIAGGVSAGVVILIIIIITLVIVIVVLVRKMSETRCTITEPRQPETDSEDDDNKPQYDYKKAEEISLKAKVYKIIDKKGTRVFLEVCSNDDKEKIKQEVERLRIKNDVTTATNVESTQL